MTSPDFSMLLDIPAFPNERYALIADKIGALLGTKNDVLLIQGEAIVAIEAVATSIARDDLTALNIVTSPYGTWFGEWLRRGGVKVTDLVAPAGKNITARDVQQAYAENVKPYDLLAFVHAESASGILNPLEAITAIAREHGTITIVDAVASIGGHRVDLDLNSIDIAVIGPQKALAGPAGVSAVSISKRAWERLAHDRAPRTSILSLMDQKEQWIDQGRGPLPGTTSPIEFYALVAALDRIDAEGIDQVVKRHETIASLTRKALMTGGLELWVEAQNASNLVTSLVVPPGISPEAFLKTCDAIGPHTISRAVGPGTERLLRMNHTGQNANIDILHANIRILGEALAKLGEKFETVDALQEIRIALP